MILINLNAGLGDGLDIDGGDSVVEGLAIGGFSTAGIQLESAGGDVIAGDFLGTDATGESRPEQLSRHDRQQRRR